MAQCDRIEMAIRTHRLWFARARGPSEQTRLPKRIMCRRLGAQGSKEASRSSQHGGGGHLRENSRVLWAIPREEEQSTWFVYGVEVKDSQD